MFGFSISYNEKWNCLQLTYRAEGHGTQYILFERKDLQKLQDEIYKFLLVKRKEKK